MLLRMGAHFFLPAKNKHASTIDCLTDWCLRRRRPGNSPSAQEKRRKRRSRLLQRSRGVGQVGPEKPRTFQRS